MKSWPDESIYEGNRLALPDEVVNYKRGDGMEKALVLLHILRKRNLDPTVRQAGKTISITFGNAVVEFTTSKALTLPDLPDLSDLLTS